MDLLAAITGQPPIHRGPKRKSGEITADPVATSAALSEPSCEYTVGLWMSTPMDRRTDTDDFSILIAEAFLSNDPAPAQAHLGTEANTTSEPPAPFESGQWDNIRCASCGELNWFWRHCCRSCGKDSTGYRHWPTKCACYACVAERGMAR